MLMRAVIVLLALVGLYLALFHGGVPLDHNSVGLGRNHTVHSVIGLAFLGVAEYLRLRYWSKPA